MRTTTSWSSPPPAWRVWEAWGPKHSVWSSPRHHGARRAADTHSPVPAPYRRRSKGVVGGLGERNTETDERQPRLEVRLLQFPRGPRAETRRRRRGGSHSGCSSRRRKQGKGLESLCSADVVAPRVAICARTFGSRSPRPPHCEAPSSMSTRSPSVHTQRQGGAVRAAWASRRLEAFLARLLLTGVKTKRFTLYQPIMFVPWCSGY